MEIPAQAREDGPTKFVIMHKSPAPFSQPKLKGAGKNHFKIYGCSGSHPLNPSHFNLQASPRGLEKSPSRASSATKLQASLIKVGYFGEPPPKSKS